MQVKNIIEVFILSIFVNVSCTNIQDNYKKIDFYHCRGSMYYDSSSYSYIFRINGDKISITKMIPDFYAHHSKDKLEYIVEGDSDQVISKLKELVKNVKPSKVDLQEKKGITITIPGESLNYYAKSYSAEQYLDPVIDVIIGMYRDSGKIMTHKRD